MKGLNIFKRFIGVLLTLSILLSVTSCIAPVCFHEWVPATCDTPKHCTICNTTDGRALIHMGGQATCSELAVCRYCGNGYGNYDEHRYSNKKLAGTVDGVYHYMLCTACNVAASPEEHSWNVEAADYKTDKKCKTCGYVAESAIEHEHVGGAASCEVGAVCELCDIVYTEPNGHTFVFDEENPNWEYADADKHYHKCTECNAPDEGEEHHTIIEGDMLVCDICLAILGSAPDNEPSEPEGD